MLNTTTYRDMRTKVLVLEPVEIIVLYFGVSVGSGRSILAAGAMLILLTAPARKHGNRFG
jgi:hypothetical protein